MVYVDYLNPIMNPLLGMDPLWALVIISLIISLFITIIYKVVTDQKLMKELKDDLKAVQKEMKEFKDHPQKVMEIQKKAMDKNMKYMMHSMKPTLFTMIPIILIFGWLNAHFAYEPIMPGEEFSVTARFGDGITGEIVLINDDLQFITNGTQQIIDGKAEWHLKGAGGGYVLEYQFGGKSYFQDLLVTETREYRSPLMKINENGLKDVRINNAPVKPLNLFGWKVGWLGTYIIFSLIFSIATRKLLKVY